MEIGGFRTFGKTQIDEFKASVAEFKQQKQQETIEEVVNWIQGMVLSSAVAGKNTLFLNITDLVVSFMDDDPRFPVPGLSCEGDIDVYLDINYIKGAVLAIVTETFTIPVILLETETLMEINGFSDLIEHDEKGVIRDIHDDEYGIVRRKHRWSNDKYNYIAPVGSKNLYHDEDAKRSELVHHEECLWGDDDVWNLRFVVELDGTIHCKGCYLYKLLFDEEIDSDNIPNGFFTAPIDHLRVAIKIPK